MEPTRPEAQAGVTRVPVPAEPNGGVQRDILSAARHCFARYGASRTTMGDVARTAGVSRPTLYRYFGDRDELLVSVLALQVRAAGKRVGTILSSRRCLEEKLTEGLGELVERGRRDPVLAGMMRDDRISPSPGVEHLWQVALGLTAEIWSDTLDDAQRRGEMRPDLSVEDACRWLAEVQFMMVQTHDDDRPLGRDAREVIATFIAPALTP